MTMLGAKFLAAAAVEKQKEELVAELEEKLKLEAMESVRVGPSVFPCWSCVADCPPRPFRKRGMNG
jgi:hypothetical protein